MPLISKEDAQKILGPFHAAFVAAVATAWAEWNQSFLAKVPLFQPRTQAAVMQDVIARELRTRLGGASGMRFPEPSRDRFWVYMELDSLIVRVKKLRSNFTISNYPTETAEAFNGQADLPGVPDGARITLGYLLSPGNEQLLGTFVALIKGSRVMWKYELAEAPGGGVSVVGEPPELPLPAVGLKLKASPAKKADRK